MTEKLLTGTLSLNTNKHPPNLIRVFAVRSVGRWGPNVSWCGQRRLWSDWTDVEADLSLRWAQRSFCWFCHAMAHLFSQEWDGSCSCSWAFEEAHVKRGAYHIYCWLTRACTVLPEPLLLANTIIWTSSREHLYSGFRPVRLKPVCSATEAS